MLGMMCFYDGLSARISVSLTIVGHHDCECSRADDYMHEVRWGQDHSIVLVPGCDSFLGCDCMV